MSCNRNSSTIKQKKRFIRNRRSTVYKFNIDYLPRNRDSLAHIMCSKPKTNTTLKSDLKGHACLSRNRDILYTTIFTLRHWTFIFVGSADNHNLVRTQRNYNFQNSQLWKEKKQLSLRGALQMRYYERVFPNFQDFN